MFYVKTLFREKNHKLKAITIERLQDILTAPSPSHSVDLRTVVVLGRLLILPRLLRYAPLPVLSLATH